MTSLRFNLVDVSTPVQVIRGYTTNRFEVVIEQHKLRRGEIGLTFHGELVAPMSDLGILDLLHDGTVEEGTFVT